MFRRRDSHKKPNEDFYLNFKSTYPAAGLSASSEAPATPAQTLNTAEEALDLSFNAAQFNDHDETKDLSLTPRGFAMDWKPTPSLMDSTNNAFHSYTNHWSSYYPPTPGGFSLSHNRAGDLHTLVLGHGQGTPLSRPGSQLGFPGQSGGLTMNDFHLQAPSPRPFQPAGLFDPNQPLLSHHMSAGFDNMRYPRDDLALLHTGLTPNLVNPSQFNFDLQNFDEHMTPQLPNSDPFRFRVTLNAPTAMIKDPDEIPISYLNKCQTYSVSVSDNLAARIPIGSIRYRTFIRISFEDEQQRARPSACWQLWKEGRGMNEAHQRGGKLQAVEFVGAGHNHSDTGVNVELVQASFDGFCVTWGPNKNGLAECSVSVRFNFLSTDFSHSKGVKGIPVRLCAKTEVINNHNALIPAPISRSQEVWYCKVKLFRDHGAERKLSNDVSHVKKTIEKLKQQIAQIDSTTNKAGKRRRSDSLSRGTANTRPSKLSKHTRTWSVSSADSASREPAEDDVQQKLATYQAMFTSTRPISILFLRGEPLDDPDLHPVQLQMLSSDQILSVPGSHIKLDRQETHNTASTGSGLSPTVSMISVNSPMRRGSTYQSLTVSTSISREASNEWTQGSEPMAPNTSHTCNSNPQSLLSPPSGPPSVSKPRQDVNGKTDEWIDALDVDQSYQTPPEPASKPVACFYIRPRIANKSSDDNYYRAIYLHDRTAASLTQAVASRCGILPVNVHEVVCVNPAGIHIKVDDEFVQAMREGQDMNAIFETVDGVKHEEDVAHDNDKCDTQPYLLKLEY